MNNKQQHTTKTKRKAADIVYKALFIVFMAFALVSITITFLYIFGELDIQWGIAGLAGDLLFILMIILFTVSTNKRAKTWSQKLAFYEKCKEYNITRITTPSEQEKAKAIAEAMNLPRKAMKDLNAYLLEIKKNLLDQEEAARQSKEDASLAERQKEEKALHTQLTMYANYTGKNKRVAMLEAERAFCLKRAKELDAAAQYGISLGQQKEIDWAVRGGIVSGLAGGAAGVAAAVDAQIKNEEIRKTNAAVSAGAAPVVASLQEQASQMRQQAKQIDEMIKQAKVKIVNLTSKEEAMQKLRFASPEITVTPTGAFFIKVLASVTKPVMILGSNKGVIDGTVLAEFYKGSTLVGQADLVLPLWGLKHGGEAVQLEGICLTGGKEGTTYRVAYKARHLFEMEA